MGETAQKDAQARAAQIARASYGRLVGILSAQSGDIAGAEDALSDALQSALVTWPQKGVPDNPEGWLVRVARNRMTDGFRRALKQHPVPVEEHALSEPETECPPTQDPRLGLLFACAHPAIAQTARGPLMLQTVLGFTAAEIARAYVGSPAATSKLLSRAKTRIKANAIPFHIPEGATRSERVRDVAEAVYGCYALVWMNGPEADAIQREAVFLADLLATEMDDDPEVLGLSALLAHLYARRNARSCDGAYVPLGHQDTSLWDQDLMAAADRRLEAAFCLGAPGRFQIEAAIQSVHAARARSGRTDWPALMALYDGLVAIAPTLGAHVGRISVIGEVHGPAAALAEMGGLEDDRVARFQPYWATRAHLLAQTGDVPAAEEAYARAISLTQEKPLRDFLSEARTRLAQA